MLTNNLKRKLKVVGLKEEAGLLKKGHRGFFVGDWEIIQENHQLTQKGKPTVRRGRKTTDLLVSER